MSIFNDKILKSVAEAAAKVMQQEELKGNQHKIDANKNGKIDAHDFKLLRAKKEVKEEVELDEAFPTVADARKRMAAGKTTSGSVTKTKTGLVHKRDYKDDNDSEDTQKSSKGYGARQNYKRSTRVNEELTFSEMIELYNEHGLKILAPIKTEEEQIGDQTFDVLDADKVNGFVETIVEEPTNDQFTKELKDQQDSAAGKKPQPKISAGKTVGVKTMPEEVELDEGVDPQVHLKKARSAANRDEQELYVKHMINYHKTMKAQNPNDSDKHEAKIKELKKNIGEEVELTERELTSDEAKKKEEYVKGMKKGLSGFKQRYGERAKSVMYATATKMAKKD